MSEQLTAAHYTADDRQALSAACIWFAHHHYRTLMTCDNPSALLSAQHACDQAYPRPLAAHEIAELATAVVAYLDAQQAFYYDGRNNPDSDDFLSGRLIQYRRELEQRRANRNRPAYAPEWEYTERLKPLLKDLVAAALAN